MSCPVCKHAQGSLLDSVGTVATLLCPRCGDVAIWGIAKSIEHSIQTISAQGNEDLRRANLSSFLRASSNGRALDLEQIARWPLDQRLPNPFEVRDTLVLMTGDRTIDPSVFTRYATEELCALLRLPISPNNNRTGAVNWFLYSEPFQEVFSDQYADEDQAIVALKSAGWAHYEKLKQEKSSSRTVFMAMQYGDSELDAVVNDCFRSAVEAAGFELRILTDKQSAGSIDDQLRVALRTARAVVADLSHGNKGAYWEAGFAEGLGRPVIYCCKKSVWDSDEKPHFDTNHLATIIWDPDNLSGAANNLTNMLRATLPHEAKMG